MNKKSNLNNHIKLITLVALFMALVIIGSRIYIGTHDTFRFHLGNSMCLLAAFILGPLYGGVAAGFGSLLFDMLFYTAGPSAIITLITKFVMGYVAGLVFYKFNHKNALHLIIAGTTGEIAYIILYGLKTFIERKFVMGMQMEAVIPIVLTKIGASVINAITAVIISTLIYIALEKSNILKTISYEN